MTLLGSNSLQILGVLTALTVIWYSFFRWYFQYWRRRNVPQFEMSFLLQSKEKFTSAMTINDKFRFLYEKAKAKGWKYVGVFIYFKPMLIITDLELLKKIMAKDFNHFVDRGTYTNEKIDPIGCHLFAIGGTKWRHLRTRLTPTFTSGKLKAMFQIFVDCGLTMEKYLTERAERKDVIDIKDVLASLTIDTIGSSAFGLECNSFKDPDSPFRTYGMNVFAPKKRTETQAVLRMAFHNFPKLGRALGWRQQSKDVSDFFSKVVTDTVNYREKNNYQRNDFLQLLINMKEGNEGLENGKIGNRYTLTMNEIIAQSFVFFIAGFETSATTMSFALFELAQHPEIQEKVREEINTVLAKYDNKITYDSVNDLKYMGQIIDETLRIYSPGGHLTRDCVEDYKIPEDNIIIEKGTRIVIPISGIHSDEEYYKNPEVFDPERFSDENKKSIPPYAYIPFGEGARICIGQRFGIMQVKVGLTSVLRSFKISLNEKTELPLKMSTTSFTLNTKGPIWMNVEKL